MQIRIDRSDLLTVLKRTSAAIEVGDQLAYKSSVLITADPLVPITFRATDGLLNITAQVKGVCVQQGRAVLTHRRLSAIVNELPPGLVDITVSPKLQVTIKSGASKRKFTMQARELDSYPPTLIHELGDTLYSVETKILQQAAAEVLFGVDKGICDGVLLAPCPELGPTRFRLMSLCSATFAAATAWFTKVSSSEETLIPRALLDAASVLPGDQTEIQIQSNAHRVTLVRPEVTISCDKLAGIFPSVWKQTLEALPKTKRFRVSSDRLYESIKAVSVAAEAVEGVERFVQIDISYKNGECIVSTRKSEKSYGEDELTVTEGSDTECVVHVDMSRISPALRSFSPAEIDVFYEVVGYQPSLVLQNENLTAMIIPISVIKGKS